MVPAASADPMAAPDTPPCPDDFIGLAGRLADAARSVVERYFRQPLPVDRKADLSPVTVADREAEAAMRRLIAEAYPAHGIVGEEHGRDAADAEYVWVLDPIDGTKRFVSGHVQFGTLVALLRRGTPILGLIDMPMMGERWVGAAGRPTRYRRGEEERAVRVRACPDVAQAILYATSPQMFKGDDFAAFERVRTRAAHANYGSDCYGYGLLASGFVDLVVEADMGPYDYLPIVPVIRGAGGVMTDWRGAPLGLGSDGRVVAAGDARCHAETLSLLATK